MQGTTAIFLVAVFLLLVLAWLVQETDPKRQYGSKIYGIVFAGLYRLQEAVAQCGQYFRLCSTEGVTAYQKDVFDNPKEYIKEHSDKKKESILSADYKKREKYNRKVLD